MRDLRADEVDRYFAEPGLSQSAKRLIGEKVGSMQLKVSISERRAFSGDGL